jgi:hypothetical protein
MLRQIVPAFDCGDAPGCHRVARAENPCSANAPEHDVRRHRAPHDDGSGARASRAISVTRARLRLERRRGIDLGSRRPGLVTAPTLRRNATGPLTLDQRHQHELLAADLGRDAHGASASTVRAASGASTRG